MVLLLPDSIHIHCWRRSLARFDMYFVTGDPVVSELMSPMAFDARAALGPGPKAHPQAVSN